MAKTLNRSLVGGLTFAGMIILAAAGFLLLANLPGRDPKVYEDEAKKHEEKKEWNQAMQAYIRACQRDPEHNPEYLVKAAKCAMEDGNVGGVRDLLTQARVKDNRLKSATDLSLAFEYEIAKLYPQPMQWNRVLNEAKKLLATEKESVIGNQSLGRAYLSLQREDAGYREKGEEALKKALELDPGNAETVELLARESLSSSIEKLRNGAKAEAENLQQAADSLVSAALAKCPPTNKADFAKLKRLQAFSSIVKNDVDKAVKELEAFAASNKDDAETYLMLAGIFSGATTGTLRQDAAKSEACFKKAIEIDPKEGRAYQGLSQHYKYARDTEKDPKKKQELFDEEYALYKKGLEVIPKTKHFREIKNNISRVGFYSELLLLDLDRYNAAGADEGKKKEALASAESWVNQLKQEIDPGSLEARFLTASLLNARGEIVTATKEAEAANRMTSANDHVRLQALLAELFFRQSQWGACSKALKRALELVPNAPMLKIRLGQVYLQMNEPTLALAELKPSEAGGLRDYLLNDEFAIQLRMEAYRQLGQTDLAAEEGRRLTKSGAGGDELRDVRLLMTEQKYNEAEAKLKPLLANNFDNEAAVRIMFRIYEATERIDDARKFMKEVIAKHPDTPIYRRFQTIILENDKNDDATLAFLKEGKEPFDRAMDIADFYVRREKLQDALKYLDEAEKLKPRDADLIDRQIRLAAAAKDWDRMSKFVARDAEINADGTEGKLALGRMAYAQGKYAEAVDLLTSGLAKYNSSLGWTYLAEVYLAMGNRSADAKTAINKALDLDPTNGFANRAMAQILLGEGNDKDAQKYVAAGARALPDDKWLKRQAQVVKEKDNPASGIASREKLRVENPKDLENLVLLARLYADSKIAKYDKAAEVYKEALQVSKNDLRLAREVARFFGREEVNRPAEGDALFLDLMNKETEKSRKAEVAVCLGQFYEVQKSLATADRYYRLAVSLDPSNDILNSAGEFYARTNRYRDSVEYYNRLKKQATKPEDASLLEETHNRIIALWLAMGDLDQAKKEIDEFVVKYPQNSQGLIYTGAYHRIGGDIAKAKEAFDAQIERDPNNAVALWQRGQMYMLMGKWQSAIDDLRKSKTFSIDGFSYQHRIALADALIESGRGDEAIVELKGILEQKPDQTAVAQALIDAYSRVRPPRYSDAENVIFTYMRMYPKDYKWPLILGQLGERMQKWDKAIQGFEKAAELSRENRDVTASLFNAYKMAGKAKAMTDYLAEKISEKQLERMPLQLAGLGWAYHQIGQKDRALESYDRALAAAGEDFMTYGRVINEMVGVLTLKEASARAKARAESDPQNIEKQKAVVHLLQNEGNAEGAIAAAKKVADLAVREQDVVFAHLAQGMLLEQSGKSSEAKAQYEAVLKVDAKQPIALNNMAFLLAETMKNPSEAVPYAQQAVRGDPNNADVLDTLGYVLLLNGRHGEAVGAFLRAKDIERDNVAVLYHLGMAFERKKEVDDAKRWFRQAKEVASKKGDKRLLPKIEEALKGLGE